MKTIEKRTKAKIEKNYSRYFTDPKAEELKSEQEEDKHEVPIKTAKGKKKGR